MKRQTIALVMIGVLMVAAGGLLAISETGYEVDLRSVVEIWGDLVRDVDRVGLTITRVSSKREMEIGRKIEEEMLRKRRRADNGLHAYVAGVGAALARHVQRKGISYRFYVLDSTVINAHATPGGGVYVTTGMLNFLQSEAELAAILGHEINHVDLKHCIERLQYELAARKIVGDDLAGIVRIGYWMVGVGFNEQQELEADAGGVILAAKAEYDPRAGIAFHERMAQVKGQKSREEKQPPLIVQELGTAVWKALKQYFATHPPALLRIQHLERVYDRNESTWRRRKFYVGRSNHRERIARGSDERGDEWKEGIQYKVVMTSGVDSDNNPVDFRIAFSVKDDKKMYLYVNWLDMMGDHRVTVKWIKPDQKVFAENIYDGAFRTADWRTWHWQKMFKNMPTGVWASKLYIDGKHLDTKKFTVTSDETDESKKVPASGKGRAVDIPKSRGKAGEITPTELIHEVEEKEGVRFKVLMTSGIEDNNPIDFKTSFSVSDRGKMYVYVYWLDAVGNHRVTVKWIRPDQKGFAENIYDDESFGTADWRTWHWKEMYKAMSRGVWTFELQLDGRYLVTKKFTVTD